MSHPLIPKSQWASLGSASPCAPSPPPYCASGLLFPRRLWLPSLPPRQRPLSLPRSLSLPYQPCAAWGVGASLAARGRIKGNPSLLSCPWRPSFPGAPSAGPSRLLFCSLLSLSFHLTPGTPASSPCPLSFLFCPLSPLLLAVGPTAPAPSCVTWLWLGCGDGRGSGGGGPRYYI